MNQEATAAFIILILACILFGCSAFMQYRMEGFSDYQTQVPQGMCGVDLPSCPAGLRCINGFCRDESTLPFSPSSGLPVKPEGYIRL